MKSFKESNLLIVSDRFPHQKDAMSLSFVKNQVDCIKDYFRAVYVVSLTPFVPKFMLGCSFMNPRWKRDAFAQDYKYDNVEVYFTKYLSTPFKFLRNMKGLAAFKIANSIILNNNIQFDMIHAHFTYPSGYVGVKLGEIYKKPTILTVHENRDWFLREIHSNDKNLIYTWANADKIIRVNRSDLEEFDRYNLDKSKLTCIPNGYPSDLFKPMDKEFARNKLGLPNDKIILVNIANLEEYKGQKYLIYAMKTILSARQDIVLYIVGQGSLERQLRSMIDANGLQDNVVLAGGNKPLEEIPLWMNACDIFVLPSISESFGIVQIEAMACGKPVVSTYNGGSEEIIIDEELGMLVKSKDSEALAEALLRALERAWDSRYICDYAKQFTWDAIVTRLLEAYRKVACMRDS
jgi:glycosyltransferase involved in cell wall biosynthesis